MTGTLLPGHKYTILTAVSGVGGTFDALTGSFPPDTLFMTTALTYDANNVYLGTKSNGKTFCDFASSGNERALCGALEGLPQDRGIASLLLNEKTLAGLKQAYAALSGNIHPSLKGALMDGGNRRATAVLDRLGAGRPDPQAVSSTAAFGQLADGNNGIWITGYGSWSETDATVNTAAMDNHLGGVLVGLDREWGDHWRFGVAGGYAKNDVTQAPRSSSAKADTWSVGAYGSATYGASAFSFGGFYNWHDIDTARTVSFPTIDPESLSASYNAQSWQLFAEASHRMRFEGVSIEPFAGISFVSMRTDAYRETGGTTALTAAADTQQSTFTTLGARTSLQLTDHIRTSGMAGWRHAFGDTDPASIFTLSGSAPFTVTGAPIARNAFVGELGIEADVSGNASLSAAYIGQYGGGTTAHGFNAGFKVRF